VRRIVRLLVLVNGTTDFEEPHTVANGASELFVQVFETRGLHARSAMCAAQLPFGACVEIELQAEIEGV
jgi:enamine deaminase RidA (YjgF/YER057c/UK114 family)